MQTLSGYSNLQKIYESENSEIFRAYSEKQQKTVILKSISDNNAADEGLHFKRELSITKDLAVEGVRKAFSLEAASGKQILVLEYFEGDEIRKFFTGLRNTTNAKIFLRAFLTTAIEIANAIQEIHNANILHRDINPNNILIHPKSLKIKIIDFGISTKYNQKINNIYDSGKLEGTIAYIPPEQTGRMNRRIDFRSDLYSLGITFYELLIGELPFQSKDPLELIHSHIAKKPNPPVSLGLALQDSRVPKIISNIVLKLISKNPEDRYQSAYGLKKDLNLCLDALEESLETLYNLKFEPGLNDFLKIFSLPEKIYGRDKELNILLNSYTALCSGNKNMDNLKLILVSGISGSGKTSLVKESLKIYNSVSVININGGFKENLQKIPYTGWVDSFREFVNILLLENEENLQKWKNTILDAVGENGQVLLEFVPEFELIIGEQKSINVKGGIEEQNRFQYIFLSFLKAISTFKFPIIITLDNLHLIDEASLALLKLLLRDNSINNILVIGIYKEEDLKNSESLNPAIKEINSICKNYIQINLNNLEEEEIPQILSDALHSNKEDLKELSSVIYKKTGGNPFFLNQFIQTLYDDGYIKLDPEKMEWGWKLKEIQNLSSTDNIADILNHKIDRLDSKAFEILSIASCIGNIFQLLILADISGLDHKEILEFLSGAVAEGIVIPLNENFELMESEKLLPILFKFSHERIQSTFYSRFNAAEKKKTHLKIAALQLKSVVDQGNDFSINSPLKKLEDLIFEITHQYQQGIDETFLSDNSGLIAKLYFIAGKQAKTSIAYGTALMYFNEGIKVLNESSWKNQYELMFNLHLYAAECSNLIQDFTESERLIKILFQNTTILLDLVLVYKLNIQSLVFQSKPLEAIHSGLEIISKLGVAIPSNPGTIRIVAGLLNLKRILLGKDIGRLIENPPIQDMNKLAAMNILNMIGASAYIAAPNIMPFVIFKIVEISVKYGNAPVSSFGYASYGLLLSGVLENYKEGMEFGKLGIQVLEKFDAREFYSSTVFVFNGFTRHFQLNPYKTAEDLKLAFKIGMESGEMEYAGYSLLTACHCLLFGQRNISRSRAEFEDALLTLEKYGQAKAFNYLKIYYSLLIRLGGYTDDPSLQEYINIQEESLDREDQTAMATYYYISLLSNYHFKEYEEAHLAVNKSLKYEEAMKGTHLLSQSIFYRLLLYAKLFRQNKIKRKEFKKLYNSSFKKLKKMAEFGPENYLHKLYLIQAEFYFSQEKINRASDFYDKAIDSAKDSDFPGDAGLAAELAAEFYNTIKQERKASYYIMESRQNYEKWGAWGKIKLLEKDHSSFLKKSNYTKTIHSSISASTYQGTKHASANLLDSVSFVKASNALSKEIRLDKLLSNMIQFLLENAGAEKGILVLKKGEHWFIEAEGDIKDAGINVLQSKSFSELNPEDNPVSIIQYAIRTKDIVLIDNAVNSEQFQKDGYIIKNQPKSILCIPMVYQNKTTGILYLENNLLSNAFQEERIQTLKLMSSQMAISIENAMLYSNLQESLEEQVKIAKAYSRFVPVEMLNYLNKKSIIDVRLGDHIEKEMTVLFSDIRGFTSLSEKMSPEENFHFINSYLRRVGPHVRNQNGFIDKYIGDAIMALFSRRPDDGLNAAIEMQKEIQVYNEHRKKSGYDPISVGIGLHTGRLMFGTVGENERLEGTVISDTVNQASRIEGLTKVYGAKIIVSENTLLKAEDPEKFLHRKLGLVKVKGKEKIIPVFEILEGIEENIKEDYSETRLSFELGIEFYQSKQFEKALELFKTTLEKIPDDRASELYFHRTKKLIAEGIPEDWEPIEIIVEK